MSVAIEDLLKDRKKMTVLIMLAFWSSVVIIGIGVVIIILDLFG